MIKIIKIEEESKYRLDKFLKIKYTSLTQSYIEKNIRKKNILINNTKTLANYIVKKNDELKILNFHQDLYKNKIIFKKIIKIPQETKKIFDQSILYQDKNFIIINKWSSISTQGGSKIKLSLDDIIKQISSNYKLVHRLDKETSGLLIISKNLFSARLFGNLFKSKRIDKSYLAICEGKPKQNESIVKLNIKTKNNKIDNTETYYKVLDTHKRISLLLFKPKTGKTHQLRIVSKNLGCPIIGDLKYNYQTKYKYEKLKLNAYKLKFSLNMKEYEFKSILPADFDLFIKKHNLKMKSLIS